MRTQSRDTTPAFEQVYIARIRAFSPAKKFASVRSWTQTLTTANFHIPYNSAEHLGERERMFHFLWREYGEMEAFAFRRATEGNAHWVSPHPDLQLALLAISDVFDHLGIPYALGGSLASSIYGFPQLVQEVVFYTDIPAAHIPALIQGFRPAFLFDEQHLREALEASSSFRLLHLASLVNVAILPVVSAFEKQLLQNKQAIHLIEDLSSLWMIGPEDSALLQLVAYRRTGANADDQWNDLLGLLKIQAPLLDLAYLQKQAVSLQVVDLLERSLIDAGIHEEP